MKKILATICSFLVLTSCATTQKPTETTANETSSPETLNPENDNADDSYVEAPAVEVTTLNSGGFKENRSYEFGSCGGNNCQSIIDTGSLASFDDYSKDKNHVYFRYNTNSGIKYEILQDLDPNSFEYVVEGFAKDKNGVYFVWRGKTLNLSVLDADPSSFEALGNSYAKDNKHVFTYADFKNSQLTCMIEDADPTTFQPLSGGWSKDKSHIFYSTEVVEGPDVASFTVIEGTLCYDKDSFYYCWDSLLEKLPGIDSASFKVLTGIDSTTKIMGEDKNHFYEIRVDSPSPLHTFEQGVDPQIVFDFAASTGIFNGLGMADWTHQDSSRELIRAELAAIASRLIMGIDQYNSSSLSGDALKEKLDEIYTDAPPNEAWNQWILKGMYYAKQYDVMQGDSDSTPTTFRATDKATGLELTKIIYAVLKKENESWDDFLTRMKSSGVLSNFDSSDSGFIEFPFYYKNEINGPTDTFRINFNQDALYEDAGVLLQALMMKNQINLVIPEEEGQD